jgi:membrane dipeptidase
MQRTDNKGFHDILDVDFPYTFVDGCTQVWPDAELEIAHRHGVTAYGVTGWRPQRRDRFADSLEVATEGIMYFHLLARRHEHVSVAFTVDDIRAAKAAGDSVFVIHAQGGEFLGNKIFRLEMFYRLGLRVMLPAYNAANLICSGCTERDDAGLTHYGHQVVEEANRVGVLLDGSHVGRRSSLEMIDASAEPMIFSHANVNALSESPRCLTDEQILNCTSRGGVVGLTPFGKYLMDKKNPRRPTLDDLVRHIEYIVQLTGSSSTVAIGTDLSLGNYPDLYQDPWGSPQPKLVPEYDQYVASDVRSRTRLAEGFDSYPKVVNLVAALQGKGWSDTDLRNLLGENFLRVYAQAWKN